MVPQVPGLKRVKVHNWGGELGALVSKAEIGGQVPILGRERSTPGFQVEIGG